MASRWVVLGSCFLAGACGGGSPGHRALDCSGPGCGAVDAGPTVAFGEPTPRSVEITATSCWTTDPPACAAEVSEGALCTQSLQTCVFQADGGGQLMVCENLRDGIALQWTALHAVTGDCSARVDSCPQYPADIGVKLEDDLGTVIEHCSGGESSIQVSFSDGCPVWFTTQNLEFTCMNDGLPRYSCLTGPVCAGTAISTLF